MEVQRHERIRVVHLVERLAVGGMEKHIEYLLQKLPPERFEQWLCCIGEPGPRADEIRAQGHRVVVLGVRYYYVPSHLMKAWAFLRRLRPHVAHTHGEFAAIFGRAAAVAARVPVVLFQAQNIPAYVQARRHVFQNRLLTALSHGIVACSWHTRRYLLETEKIPARKVAVVHNCVDISLVDAGRHSRGGMRRAFGFGPDDVVLGTVSRLAPVKGHADLLHAMASVLARRPSARLLIVGDGPERPRLEALAVELSLGKRVTFAGMRGDVPRVLAGLDVFVQPTAEVEGLPLSIAEAMAARLPVVATDVGGVREAVVDRDNGFVVPPRNAAALASPLAALVGDPGLRLRMGHRSRERCEAEFSVDLMAQRTAALYTAWVGQRCPRLMARASHL